MKPVTRKLGYLAIISLLGFSIAVEAQQQVQPPSVTGAKKTFNPADFKLSDLVKNLDQGNYFDINPKAHPYLRQVLASGQDFTFGTHQKKGIYAYITSNLGLNVWINLSYPRKRIGQAICHELLHFEDMKTFKPVNKLSYAGLKREQGKVFYSQVADLVNMISHEYVKQRLEKFEYENALIDTGEARLKRLVTGLNGLEKTFPAISRQLAAASGKNTVGINNLQSLYQDLMLMTLRDQLLFDGAYEKTIDELLVRFQSILDFMRESTKEDPRFKRVYLDVKKTADSIRTACGTYHESERRTANRYALLKDTLSHMNQHVGISFSLVPRAPEAPILKATSRQFQLGESFVLDGKFIFSNVKVYTPPKKQIQPKQP